MEIWSWDAGVDFLAVVEHRLIPARVRSEWARLRRKGLAIVWAPASQDTSHVGHAGVGVVSLRGAGVVGFCIWWCCMGIRELILMLRSLL